MKQGFVIHHNGPLARCLGRPHTRCEAFWQAVEDYHVETKGWSAIAYSFGMCPHGIRFEGRGWFRNQVANGSDVVGVNDGKDSEWYTVLVFLGWDPTTGVEEEPTPEMIQGVADLITEGRNAERCADRVLPHNAFKIKRCPGRTFTRLAARWNDNIIGVSAGTSEELDMDEATLRRILEEELRDHRNTQNLQLVDAIGDIVDTAVTSIKRHATTIREGLASLIRGTHPGE